MNGELGRGDVDFGIANFFISLVNLEVLDFTAPYKAEVKTLLTTHYSVPKDTIEYITYSMMLIPA